MFKNDGNLHFDCEVCVLSKYYRSVYPRTNRKSNSLFSIVYSDVWGSAPNTPMGYLYFVIFIDDVS